MDALVVLTLVLAVLIPVVMIGGGVWFVTWYMQRKFRRAARRGR
ncbi:MAG: hypothetical protein QOE90_2061 [Thermoplasmata archaeon]|jgi:Flp pilus assembly pilin Flp|nr:hypothetical protein [Thermoplasmata archaeon]